LSYSSTSKASPNDTGIVIIIIIIGKVEIVGFEHRGEIIAQSFFLFRFSVFGPAILNMKKKLSTDLADYAD
jgi:hypothetical protein